MSEKRSIVVKQPVRMTIWLCIHCSRAVEAGELDAVEVHGIPCTARLTGVDSDGWQVCENDACDSGRDANALALLEEKR